MTRDEVINAVACPPCGAPAGEPCRGQTAVHLKRVGRAEMLHGWQSDGQSAALARPAATGDVRTLEMILHRADSELYRSEAGTLNRGGIEELLADSLGDGFPRAEKEVLIADAALIRLDLAPPGSSPAEALMTSRASVSWLEVRLLEFDRADLLAQQVFPYQKLETLDRMLSRASGRLERSLLALGKPKRLKRPVVVAAQINL